MNALEGNIPIYFYGQQYGFSTLETLLVAIGIKIFGHTSLAIRMPMLFLFLIAFTFFVLNLKRLINKDTLLIVLIIVLSVTAPSWILASLKARGGYLTAFFISNLMVFLALYKDINKIWVLISQGFLVVLLFESQKLWIPSTILIVIASLSVVNNYFSVSWRKILALTTSIVISFSAFHLYKQKVYTVWQEPKIGLLSILNKLPELPSLILSSFNGNYWLHISFDEKFNLNNTANSVLLLVIILISINLFIKAHFKNILPIIIISAIFGSLIGYIAPLSSSRYLLPLHFTIYYCISFLIICFPHKIIKRLFTVLSIVIIAAQVHYLPKFLNYSFINISAEDNYKGGIVNDDTALFEDLLGILRLTGVNNVVSVNNFLQYYIIYFSGGEIVAVGPPKECRIPENLRIVRNNYIIDNNNIAAIGFNMNRRASNHVPIVIKDKIWFLPRPPKIVLSKLNLYPPDFEIPDH